MEFTPNTTANTQTETMASSVERLVFSVRVKVWEMLLLTSWG